MYIAFEIPRQDPWNNSAIYSVCVEFGSKLCNTNINKREKQLYDFICNIKCLHCADKNLQWFKLHLDFRPISETNIFIYKLMFLLKLLNFIDII
jgi:hypothetical protein